MTEGLPVHLNPYIGVALSRETRDPQQLLRHAVSSMLACKDSGYKVFFHSPALADNHARQNQLENYLLQAVRNNDLLLYFQPKVSMKTSAGSVLRHCCVGSIRCWVNFPMKP